MGNIFVKSEQIPTRPDRQILTPEYVRRLIDRHYESCTFRINIDQITTFIQKTYSPNITDEMVEEALRLEPSYIHFPEKMNCHSLMYA